MTPESMSKAQWLLSAEFVAFWSCLGSLLGRLLVQFNCQETIVKERSEHVMFDDSSTFSHDFEAPQGTKKQLI